MPGLLRRFFHVLSAFIHDLGKAKPNPWPQPKRALNPWPLEPASSRTLLLAAVGSDAPRSIRREACAKVIEFNSIRSCDHFWVDTQVQDVVQGIYQDPKPKQGALSIYSWRAFIGDKKILLPAHKGCSFCGPSIGVFCPSQALTWFCCHSGGVSGPLRFRNTPWPGGRFGGEGSRPWRSPGRLEANRPGSPGRSETQRSVGSRDLTPPACWAWVRPQPQPRAKLSGCAPLFAVHTHTHLVQAVLRVGHGIAQKSQAMVYSPKKPVWSVLSRCETGCKRWMILPQC